MAEDPYRVLGVDRDADSAELRQAYLAQLRENHPDLRPGDAAAEERTRQLNQAWERIGRREPDPGASIRLDPARPRPAPPAYSHHQRDFRTAFTTATLRIALVVLALGLVLITLGR